MLMETTPARESFFCVALSEYSIHLLFLEMITYLCVHQTASHKGAGLMCAVFFSFEQHFFMDKGKNYYQVHMQRQFYKC